MLVLKKVSNGFIYSFGALGDLLFGYDIASVSGAILFISKQLHLGPWQQGWVVSSVLIGAIGDLFFIMNEAMPDIELSQALVWLLNSLKNDY